MDVQYVALLLRLWKVGAGEGQEAIWRASLEDPHTGEVRGFASLDALVAYLATRLRGQLASPGADDSVDAPSGAKRGRSAP